MPLGSSKNMRTPFSFLLCFENTLVCGAEAIILHHSWFCETPVTPAIKKHVHIAVHHDSVGPAFYLKAEGCVCGWEGVCSHSVNALGVVELQIWALLSSPGHYWRVFLAMHPRVSAGWYSVSSTATKFSREVLITNQCDVVSSMCSNKWMSGRGASTSLFPSKTAVITRWALRRNCAHPAV